MENIPDPKFVKWFRNIQQKYPVSAKLKFKAYSNYYKLKHNSP